MIFEAVGLENLPEVAAQIAQQLRPGIISVEGEMAAGKTTTISAILKALGIVDPDGSPTYSLVNEYEVDNRTIYHFDLYRLNSAEELYDIGIENYLDKANTIVLVEWFENGENVLPKADAILQITENGVKRRIEYRTHTV